MIRKQGPQQCCGAPICFVGPLRPQRIAPTWVWLQAEAQAHYNRCVCVLSAAPVALAMPTLFLTSQADPWGRPWVSVCTPGRPIATIFLVRLVEPPSKTVRAYHEQHSVIDRDWATHVRIRGRRWRRPLLRPRSCRRAAAWREARTIDQNRTPREAAIALRTAAVAGVWDAPQPKPSFHGGSQRISIG